MISCPQVFLVCGHIYFGRGWCVFIFASKLSPPNKFEVRKQHPQKDEKTNNIVVWNTFLSLEIPMCWCDRVALKLSCCGTICIKHPANTHRSIKYCHTHTASPPLPWPIYIFTSWKMKLLPVLCPRSPRHLGLVWFFAPPPTTTTDHHVTSVSIVCILGIFSYLLLPFGV